MKGPAVTTRELLGSPFEHALEHFDPPYVQGHLPCCLDTLYSYMPSFIMESAVISPILLKRIEEVTFTSQAFWTVGWQNYRVPDTEWFVLQVLIRRMTSEKGGRLGAIGVSLPDDWMHVSGSDLWVADDGNWIWALVDQVIKGLAEGRFDRLRFGYYEFNPPIHRLLSARRQRMRPPGSH